MTQPSDTWSYMDHYMHYSSENEANPLYHKWACLFTLSAAVSKHVWVQQGGWKVYPNIYCLFVGDPASGKSTALSFAERLVHKFTDYPIAPSSITREMLTQTMGKTHHNFTHDGKTIQISHMTVCSDELVMFLGAEPVRMVDFVTSVYSCEGAFRVATKNKGVDEILNPCLVMVGLLTPSTLNSMLTQNLVSGGFSRRVLLVYAKERGAPRPFPEFNDSHRDSETFCINYAKDVQKLAGPFAWTDPAKVWFSDWYINVKDVRMRNESNDIMRSYWTARDNLMLKVAMLLALSKKRELVLDIETLMEADEMLTNIEPDILTILGGGGRNELAPITLQILNYIKDNPSGVREALIRARFMTSANDNEIMAMLNHLVDTHKITRHVSVTTDGRPSSASYFPA